MDDAARETLRASLHARRAELDALLERIRSNITRGLHPDSKERAKELEDKAVVDALGNDAVAERRLIDATLGRLDDGTYGICQTCKAPIAAKRLTAYPYAMDCLDCAAEKERSVQRA